MTFGRKEAQNKEPHAHFDTRWALSVLQSPISNVLLDLAKLMYLNEKTPRAEDSWLPLNREPAAEAKG